MNIRTYRVWMTDGSAILIDAESADDAMYKANKQCDAGQYPRCAECIDNF